VLIHEQHSANVSQDKAVSTLGNIGMTL
jgi:hypothetical protein